MSQSIVIDFGRSSGSNWPWKIVWLIMEKLSRFTFETFLVSSFSFYVLHHYPYNFNVNLNIQPESFTTFPFIFEKASSWAFESFEHTSATNRLSKATCWKYFQCDCGRFTKQTENMEERKLFSTIVYIVLWNDPWQRKWQVWVKLIKGEWSEQQRKNIEILLS